MRIEATKPVPNQRLDNSAADESRQGLVNHKPASPESASEESGSHESGFRDPAETAGRAIVATAPIPVGPAPANYRQATFLAHLIATREMAPQTRVRRRVEPREAAAAYRATAALVGH
ncbi:MAG: hypothetical protein WC670_02030 [Pseudolabrys sp.]|jgi:hypothetical protein